MSGITSPAPFIKDEPDDFHFSHNNQYMHNVNGQQYGSWDGNHGDVDPQDLNMNGQRNYNTSNNMSSSFIAGNSGVTDDDLLGSLDLGDQGNSAGNMRPNQPRPGFTSSSSLPRQQQHFNHNFSNTPEGAPINSPFVNGFDFNQWNAAGQNNGQHLVGSLPSSRPGFATERASSMSRSPMTPMTPGMSNLQLGTPDSSSFPRGGQSVPVNSLAQHRKSSSQQWGSLDSGFSYIDSPLSSPSAPQHAQISEVLKSGGSLSHSGHKARPSVEDKKARRRASHNEVERKRRNNINNQITILSKLVPPHRLEDDNIRRALASNTSLPPSVTGEGLGMSPPQATSLLAGGQGRRAAGGITQGLPIDERDKIPAKGDVLNSSVGWTKDLMWLLNRMMQRESILQETIESLGGQSPVQITEEENRMRTELLDTFSRNNVGGFEYSRRHGSGLWVPGHTNHAGEVVSGDHPNDASTGMQQHGSGSSAGAGSQNVENQFWGYPDENELKEEDEFNINMEI